MQRTGINLASDEHSGFANASLHHRAVLGVIIHYYILAVFNESSWSRIPLVRKHGQSLKLITLKEEISEPMILSKAPNKPQKLIRSCEGAPGREGWACCCFLNSSLCSWFSSMKLQ